MPLKESDRLKQTEYNHSEAGKRRILRYQKESAHYKQYKREYNRERRSIQNEIKRLGMISVN